MHTCIYEHTCICAYLHTYLLAYLHTYLLAYFKGFWLNFVILNLMTKPNLMIPHHAIMQESEYAHICKYASRVYD